MVMIVNELTAAKLALNYDLFSETPFLDHATAKKWRKVKSVTCVGGAGVADLKMDLFYGSTLICKMVFNVATGLSGFATMKIPIAGSESCAPDTKISLIVTDAGNTNPYNIKVEIV